MASTYTVAAFKTSGSVPSKGGRITQLLLIKLSDEGREIDKLQLPDNATNASADPALTPEVFSRIFEFVGGSNVVTHDGYNWKRFLRQEFASKPKDKVKSLLALTIDISEWSRERFPKQRKDIDAICKRLKIVVPPSLVGLDREVVAITKILPFMGRIGVVSGEKNPPQTSSQVSTPEIGADTKRPESFFARLQRAGNVLRGIQKSESY